MKRKSTATRDSRFTKLRTHRPSRHESPPRCHAPPPVTLAITACSHTHEFDPQPPVSSLPSSPLQGRIIYLDVSRIPETYETSVDGSSFSILGVRTHGRAVVKRLFANERFTSDPSQSDVTLRGELKLDLGPTFGGTTCKAHARWTIVDDEGEAVGEGDGSSSIGTMANGGNNCEIASLLAHSAALDAAMDKLK